MAHVKETWTDPLMRWARPGSLHPLPRASAGPRPAHPSSPWDMPFLPLGAVVLKWGQELLQTMLSVPRLVMKGCACLGVGHERRLFPNSGSRAPAPPPQPLSTVTNCSSRRGPVESPSRSWLLPLCHLLGPRLAPRPSCCLSSEPPWIPAAGISPAAVLPAPTHQENNAAGPQFPYLYRGTPVCVTPWCGWNSTCTAVGTQ